jgi:curved DNA-binding protein CbpA
MTQRTGESASPPDAVEIPEDFQREIRAFAAELPEMDCYQILGVARDVSTDAIRGAFFERSRRFHPDRYFNKSLGPYASLLHELYKRIVAANEVLRDPDLRKRYERSLGPPKAKAGPAAAVEPSAPAEEVATPATPSTPSAPPRPPPGAQAKPAVARPSTGKSLRDRRGLRAPLAGLDGLERQLALSRDRARNHYQQAKECAEREDWAGAVGRVRMALAFAPRERSYHDGMAQWLPRANQEAALKARERGESALLNGETAAALDAFAEALERSPTDAALAVQTAGLALQLRDFNRAIQFAECAAALEERDVRTRKLLGMVLRAAGKREEARRALQRAWELDPTDREIKAALVELGG